MDERLQAVESSLKFWRAVILFLTIIMLTISFIVEDEMAVIVLIICFFSLILFKLKNLPTTSYQLFILLQMAYLIYLTGKLLETLYYQSNTSILWISKVLFDMLTLSLFIVILWRHYQKDQLIGNTNIEVEQASD